MAWTIAVMLTASLFAAASAFAVGTGVLVAAGVGGGAAAHPGGGGAPAASPDPVQYYIDVLFRPSPGAPVSAGPSMQAPGAQQPGAAQIPREEVARIIAASAREGKLSDDDRNYLARLVAARTGLTEDEAQRRVAEVETRARESVKQLADTARKAASFASFWTFMSLLIGAVAATLAGMLGGELRDDEWRAPAN